MDNFFRVYTKISPLKFFLIDDATWTTGTTQNTLTTRIPYNRKSPTTRNLERCKYPNYNWKEKIGKKVKKYCIETPTVLSCKSCFKKYIS